MTMFPLGGTLTPLAVSGVAVSPFLVYDTFTGADDTLISARNPDVHQGSTWVAVFAPVPKIASNAAKTSGVNSSAYIESGSANVEISADYTFITGENYSGLLARATDSLNYYRCYFDSGYWYLQRRQAGGNTGLGWAAQTLTSGATYSIKLTVNGTTITLLVDGVEKITATSQTFNQTATTHGLLLNASGTELSRMDNFKIVSAS